MTTPQQFHEPAVSPVEDAGLVRPVGKLRVKKASKQFASLMRRAEAARAKGQTRKAQGLDRMILRSMSGRLVATHDANRKLKPKYREGKAALHNIAANMNVFKPGKAKAIVSYINERGKKPRKIRSFDLPSRAAQRLMQILLQPRSRTLSTQFLSNGGPANAIAYVKGAIEAGYEFVQQLDVTDCYGSYNERRIATFIDLPEKVAQANLVTSTVHDTYSTTTSTLSLAMLPARGQSGIPAGSLASPLVSENLLAIAISEAKQATDFPSDVRVVSWADNLVVLSRSQRDLERTVYTLRSSFSDSPVGSLKLREVGPGGRQKSFDFIGYRLTRKRCEVMVSVTPANRRRLIVELNHQVREGKIGMYDVREKLSSWASSMFLWANAKQWASMINLLYRSRESGRTILALQANFASMLDQPSLSHD